MQTVASPCQVSDFADFSPVACGTQVEVETISCSAQTDWSAREVGVQTGDAHDVSVGDLCESSFICAPSSLP